MRISAVVRNRPGPTTKVRRDDELSLTRVATASSQRSISASFNTVANRTPAFLICAAAISDAGR